MDSVWLAWVVVGWRPGVWVVVAARPLVAAWGRDWPRPRSRAPWGCMSRRRTVDASSATYCLRRALAHSAVEATPCGTSTEEPRNFRSSLALK